MAKNKLLIICGPTATGKTDLAIKLAQKFNGEIVSADSRQVYKRMDIGTGKDLPKNSKLQYSSANIKFNQNKIGYYLFENIPIWLLDIVNPDYRFTVADYVECAQQVVNDLHKRGKLPILVGGTGLYIKGIIDGIGTLGVAPDWELRERLGYYDTKILGEKLRELAPGKWERMNQSDRKNPRRLVRAIEVALESQKSLRPELRARAKSKSQNYSSKVKSDSFLIIGLRAALSTLYQRIDQRVDERVRKGISQEIKNLLNHGYSWENSVLGTTIGYHEWKPYFEKKSTIEEVVQQWKFDEHNYARRQMTWFKKDKRICWFDISQAGFTAEIEKLVDKWYNNL